MFQHLCTSENQLRRERKRWVLNFVISRSLLSKSKSRSFETEVFNRKTCSPELMTLVMIFWSEIVTIFIAYKSMTPGRIFQKVVSTNQRTSSHLEVIRLTPSFGTCWKSGHWYHLVSLRRQTRHRFFHILICTSSDSRAYHGHLFF